MPRMTKRAIETTVHNALHGIFVHTNLLSPLQQVRILDSITQTLCQRINWLRDTHGIKDIHERSKP